MPTPTMLTFEYVKEKQALKLAGELVAGWEEEDRCISNISLSGLRQHKEQFRIDVQRLEQKYGSRLGFKSNPDGVCRVLDEFFWAGRSFWYGISDDKELKWLDRIGELLTRGLPDEWWTRLDPHTLARSVYHVETKGPPEALLPLDALPLSDYGRAVLAYDEDDVFLLASLFGGFRSIVRHSPDIAGTYLHSSTNAERATLYFRSVEVDGYDEMRKVLEQTNATFLGSFPSDSDYHQSIDIAKALIIRGVALGTHHGTPDVVQIHAHAVEGKGEAERLIITFDYGSGQYTIVRSSHFQRIARDIKELRKDGTPVGVGPLVIFNACEALGTIGNELLSSGLNLPTLGSRAVIGPREEILADFAVKFSKILHEELGIGSTIGEAAVAARWKTLAEHLNPSGILYAIFGDVESKRNLPLEKVG